MHQNKAMCLFFITILSADFNSITYVNLIMLRTLLFILTFLLLQYSLLVTYNMSHEKQKTDVIMSKLKQHNS